MANQHRTFTFVVELLEGGWTVLGAQAPLGPFNSKEQAVHLAEGMAASMRLMGDEVVVRVKD